MKGRITMGGESQSEPLWHLTEHTINDSIEVVSPTGFKLIFTNIDFLVDAMANLTSRGAVVVLSDGRLYVSPNGALTVIDCDPWHNPNFKLGDEVGNAIALAHAIATFIKVKLNGNRSSGS